MGEELITTSDVTEVIEKVTRTVTRLRYKPEHCSSEEWDEMCREGRDSLRRFLTEFVQSKIEQRDSQEWTLFWATGRCEVVKGTTIEQAFSLAGYGGGAVGALWMHSRGDVRDEYEWKEETRRWDKLELKEEEGGEENAKEEHAGAGNLL